LNQSSFVVVAVCQPLVHDDDDDDKTTTTIYHLVTNAIFMLPQL